MIPVILIIIPKMLTFLLMRTLGGMRISERHVLLHVSIPWFPWGRDRERTMWSRQRGRTRKFTSIHLRLDSDGRPADRSPGQGHANIPSSSGPARPKQRYSTWSVLTTTVFHLWTLSYFYIRSQLFKYWCNLFIYYCYITWKIHKLNSFTLNALCILGVCNVPAIRWGWVSNQCTN